MRTTIIKTHGGKSYLFPWLAQHFHENISQMKFFDVCGGGGTVVLRKDPSIEDNYNDIHFGLFTLLSNICNQEFIDKIKKIEYNQETFNHYLNFSPNSDIEIAIKELVVRRMSRGGLGKNFSYSKRLRGGKPGDVNAWDNWKELHLPNIINRMKNVKIHNKDLNDLIRENDSENTFFYIDPPYVTSTRTALYAYDYEMSESDHKRMGNTLKSIRGKAMVSGYDNPLYNKMFIGWNREHKSVANHSSQSKIKQARLECIWCNY